MDTKLMHELISDAEGTARQLRLASGGEFSLAVVRNHAKTARQREGMSWDDAHDAVERRFGEVPTVR